MSTATHTLSDAAIAAPAITGSSDVYLILGDPVAQVRAPESFNLVFKHLGINAVLVPVHVAPQDLAAFVKAAFSAHNIKGMWVTIPHKTPIMELLDLCSDRARAAGAVNALRRLPDGRIAGDLFDGEGFVASLDYYAIAYAGRRVLVIGAGGAAAAIGASLLLASAGAVAEIAFFDPAPGQAQALADRLGRLGRSRVRAVCSSDPAGFDLVVNASPLGLRACDPLPCDVARMDAGAALVDILMKNQPTPVVRAARARALVAQPGFEMMIQQTHLYLEFFGFGEASDSLRGKLDFIRDKISQA